MAVTTKSYERKDLGTPDEVRTFEKGTLELVKIGGGVIGHISKQTEHIISTQ